MTFELISPQDYQSKWTVLREVLFSGGDIDDNPFNSSEFGKTIIPGGTVMEEDRFRIFANLIKSLGDSEMVICVHTVENKAWIGPLDYDTFRTRVPATVSTSRQLQIFGQSGKWGLMTHVECVGVFASEPSVIEIYHDAVGGEEALRKEFDRNDFSVGHGEGGDRFRGRLRKVVGW